MPRVTGIGSHPSEGSGWHLPPSNEGDGMENCTVVPRPTGQISSHALVATVHDSVEPSLA